MNRGARHEVILANDVICADFLTILGELRERFDVVVHGYALMPNHYHLMLESRAGQLSQAMQHLGASFTKTLNRRRPDWDGPVFRGRFKNQLVSDDAYWRHLLAYLHLNPVRAGLAPWLDQTRWTSHHAYIGALRPQEWLETDELLGLFGGVEAYLEYVWEHHVGRRAAPPEFDAGKLWRPRRSELLPPLPVEPVVRMEPEEALARVIEVTGVSAGELRGGVFGPHGTPARWLAVWWLQRTCRLQQREIAGLLAANLSQVSRWLRRVEDARIGTTLDAWKDELLHGERPIKVSSRKS